MSEGAARPGGDGTWPGWLSLWREASRGCRAGFVALALLFTQRALYRDPHPDRLGFQRLGEAVLAASWNEDALINTYPPPFSLVMAPIALVAQKVGDEPVRVLWGAAQLASLVYLTLASLAALGLTPSLGLIALTWLCSWRFVVGDLNSQNVTLFLEALVTAGILQASRGRTQRAGRILGLGACLKVWPGFAVLGWLGSRGPRARQTITGLLGGVGLTTLATVTLLGVDRTQHGLQFWFERVAPHFGGPELQNQAWKGLMLRALGTSHGALPQLLALALGLTLLGLLLALIALRPAPSRRVSALDASLAIAVGLPCFPTAWYFYEVSLIPILLAVLGSLRKLDPRRRRRTLPLLGVGLLLAGFVDRALVGLQIWSAAAAVGNTLFGALAIVAAGWQVREAWRAEDLLDLPSA